MFIWYRNSILASIISLIGCGGVIAGVTELFKDEYSRELSVGACIAFIAVGIALAIWGRVISNNKEKKKQEAKAAGAGVPVSSGNPAQTSRSAYAAQAASGYAAGATAQPVKTSLSLATFCYLLSAVFSFWGFYMYNQWRRLHSMGGIFGTQDFDRFAVLLILAGVCCLLAVFACVTTKKRQDVFLLFVAVFLGLMAVHAIDAVTMYQRYGFGSVTLQDGSTVHAMTAMPILRIAAFFLMLLFACFATKKNRLRFGGFVRWCWFLPVILLVIAFFKHLSDGYILDMLSVYLSKRGATFRPEFMDALAHSFLILGVLFSGFAFRSFCKKVETAPAQPDYASAAPQPASYTPPVYSAPAQPQSAPRQASCAPVEPAPAPAPAAQGGNKQLQAYKDLLECGILTQEEYDQKIRELMQ